MRSNIPACAFAMGMLIAVSVFAQDPGTKPEKTSQAASAAPAQKPHRVRVKEDVQEAKLVLMAFPASTRLSVIDGYGTVVLRVIIDKSGAVKSARYVSGPANLKNSATAAVLQWRYKPTLINGVPVEVDTTVSLAFNPPEKGVHTTVP